MDPKRLMTGWLIGVVVVMVVGVRPSHGVLLQDNGLIFDTESGLHWAPVGLGVLAPEDLAPGFRYATSTEVDGLLSYLPDDPCINVAPSTPCGNQTLEDTLDFISIFRAGFSNQLRAIYDPSLFPDGSGMAMALNLFVDLPTQFITFDTQGVNFPPASSEEGMFLVRTAIPELSALLLIGSGALIGLWYSWKNL